MEEGSGAAIEAVEARSTGVGCSTGTGVGGEWDVLPVSVRRAFYRYRCGWRACGLNSRAAPRAVDRPRCSDAGSRRHAALTISSAATSFTF